jgi:molecular chaperone GrpE
MIESKEDQPSREESGAPDAPAEAATTKPEPDGKSAPGNVSLAVLESALEEARADAESARELHIRAAAELENVRRRAARDVENAHKYGVERLAAEMLAVKDSLEMGLDSAREAGIDKAVEEGFDAVLKLLVQCLGKFGISEVNPDGDVFDPELHEAMAAQPSADVEPGVVLNVVQKGYRIHDRLLRPARVIVSRAVDE